MHFTAVETWNHNCRRCCPISSETGPLSLPHASTQLPVSWTSSKINHQSEGPLLLCLCSVNKQAHASLLIFFFLFVCHRKVRNAYSFQKNASGYWIFEYTKARKHGIQVSPPSSFQNHKILEPQVSIMQFVAQFLLSVFSKTNCRNEVTEFHTDENEGWTKNNWLHQGWKHMDTLLIKTHGRQL